MDISLFNYNLPEHYIAKYPASKRDESKLLIYNRKSDIIIHTKFRNIVNFLNDFDILIGNNVEVIPARLFGKKETGGKVEILLIKNISDYKWQVLIQASKYPKIGSKIIFKDFHAKVIEKNIVEFNIPLTYEMLKKIDAQIPIPPYLKRNEEDIDKIRYQTIFSDSNKKGAIAAPTAGLHFTEEIIAKLKRKNIDLDFITLYVGIGTFTPIRTNNILEHKMHTEQYEISEEVAIKINNSLKQGKKIVAIGTTTVRALEDNFLKFKEIKSGVFSTDLFIFPGFKFNIVSKLITNFHLPKSSLLILVSAFAGRENILKCYEIAKLKNYRFFSYGDSMLII